jgi:hypothetical protein
MQTQDLSNVQFCVPLHVIAGVHVYKVGRLGKAVNNHPYGIKFVDSQR